MKTIKYANIALKFISVALLLLAAQKLKYTQYELIRFLLFAIFTASSYLYYKSKFGILSLSFILLAVLFQPFLKISLGRSIWMFVDYVLAASVFIVIVFEIFLVRKNKFESKS